VKTKFLAIHQGHELYGSDRSFISSIQTIKEHYPNYDLRIILPQEGPLVEVLKPYADELLIEDIGVVSMSYAKKHPFKSLVHVIKSAFHARTRIKEADIIYINTIVPFGYILAGFFTLKSIIVHVREIPSPIVASIFSLWFYISRFFTIYNSNATQKAFFFKNSKKARVLWNGVEPLHYDDSLKKETDKISLLLIGRISVRKGQKFFLETLSRLSDIQKKMFIIYIIGDEPPNQVGHREELLNSIKENSLEKIVFLYPFDKNPQKYYSWADAVVIPSIQPESFGRIAIEAMSISKPVIASNQGGLSEIVVDKVTGWLFHPNDSEDLENVLLSVIANKNTLLEYGFNGKKRYDQNFDLAAYKRSFIEILTDFKIGNNKSNE
jgi:glycosyltransferase involved in cell wall biosynthesis